MEKTNKEVLLAIEALIANFASNQFLSNGVSRVESVLIMDSISNSFRKACLSEVMYNRINFDNKEESIPFDNCGSPEEFEKALKESVIK